MNCLICKTDITEPIKQFGNVKTPLCQSCYLNGNTWVYGEEIIVDELLHGADLETAQKICIKQEMTDLQKFAEDFLNLPFTDTAAIEPEADSARFHGQEAAV